MNLWAWVRFSLFLSVCLSLSPSLIPVNERTDTIFYRQTEQIQCQVLFIGRIFLCGKLTGLPVDSKCNFAL